jgi:branched-chain amino acid transport system permease protein
MPTVQLQDWKMQYREHGSGEEPIVFIHGFVASDRWWLPTFDRLPEQYHSYAINLRAYGGEEPVLSGHTIARYAEDLAEFVDALGLERFDLVAHSLGAGVAMQYALDHQDRLKSLVLVDPLAPYGTRLDPGVTDWINAQHGNREGIEGIALGGCVIQPVGEYRVQLVDDAMAWTREGYLGMMDDMARFNVSDRLPELNVPTLVTWGDKDLVIPFSAIVDAFTKIPGCSLEIWHGVGHNGPIEIPDRFVELLARFIAEARQVAATGDNTPASTA